MSKKFSKHLIIISCILAAFILFVIFVYLPAADRAGKSSRIDDAYWPSENFRDPLQAVPGFSFIDQQSIVRTQNDVRGKVYVADFFFTTCEAACPMMKTQLTRVQEKFSDEDDFRILSFALDPNDTLPVIRSFANLYHADNAKWYFLSGDVNDIYNLGEKGFMQVVHTEDGNFNAHSQKFTLVDKNGMIRGFYLGTDSAEVDNLINDIAYLLKKEQR